MAWGEGSTANSTAHASFNGVKYLTSWKVWDRLFPFITSLHVFDFFNLLSE
jgi:hypothetical protein